MNSRLQSLFNLAFHSETPENEAIASFLKLSKLIAKDNLDIFNILENTSGLERTFTFSNIPQTYYSSVLNTIFKTAKKCDLTVSNITMTHENNGYVSTADYDIVVTGSKFELDRFKEHLRNVKDQILEQTNPKKKKSGWF